MLIGERKLARYLRVTKYSVEEWRKAGLMPPVHWQMVRGRARVVYDSREVNPWLVRHCRNVEPDKRLRLEDLMSGRVRLLSCSEAQELLRKVGPISYTQLVTRCKDEAWPVWLTPQGRHRYFYSHIMTLRQPPIRYKTNDVKHVFGVGHDFIFERLKEGKLVASGRPAYYTEESIVSLLREYLPEGHNPYMWLRARMASKHDLATCTAISRHLGVHFSRVLRLAKSGQIPGLYLRQHHWRIPLEALPLICKLLGLPPP